MGYEHRNQKPLMRIGGFPFLTFLFHASLTVFSQIFGEAIVMNLCKSIVMQCKTKAHPAPRLFHHHKFWHRYVGLWLVFVA